MSSSPRASSSRPPTRRFASRRLADSGPGIPSTQLDAIFEPFVQLHAADDLEHRGLGLGLTIARDLTRLMGGELLVHSVVGVGSLFTVCFPAAPRAAEQSASVSPAKAAA